ncbi:MAG: ABC transporter substrate binding protein [Woeseiaceae bacterium]|nr:ABC transporter substrate binding protein [Woeseiaceae bacterium]
MQNRLYIALVALVMSGCAVFAPEPVTDSPPVAPELPPAKPPPPPPTRAVPAPEPTPAPDPPAADYTATVAVILSSRALAYESVAIALDRLLENAEVYNLDDRSLSVRDAFAAIHASGAAAVVAIGLPAAVRARDFAEVPVVFAQVFNAADYDLLQGSTRGIAVMPPLDRQLERWLALTPDIRSIGAIVGSGHDSLLSEAERAADANSVTFQSRVAASDRETLYLFRRMLPQIDAFWLFPDNRILSPAVLREMLEQARRHDVHVAVFNDSLLELGATLSATTDPDDIAATIVDVLHRIEQGRLGDVPSVSPLTEVRTRVNDRLERQLRLAEGETAGTGQ